MKTLIRSLRAAIAVAIVALLLIALAAGFAEVIIAVSGALGLHHALGIDTQSSQNYDFVSGVGPMFLAALGFSGVGATMFKHVNCEEKGCWRLGHRHPDHGRPVCRHHYHRNVVPDRP